MTPSTAIGIDLGGTRIKGVLLQSDGMVLRQMLKDTNDRTGTAGFTWKIAIRDMVRELQAGLQAELPIGICTPGLPSEDHRWVANLPGRLAGLEKLYWAEYLEEPHTFVVNDAQAAMLAEYHFGVGRGKKHVILLTLGTGVGGAIVTNGQLYQGHLNRAGHLGHFSQHPFGAAGIVHLPGTLEMAIGNATVAERSKGRFEQTEALVKAYQQGDSWATLVWLESIRALALGLSSLINVLSPEMVILSGGITQARESLFGPLKKFMGLYEWKPGGTPIPIVPAQFEAQAGAVGAARFALNQVHSIPDNF